MSEYFQECREASGISGVCQKHLGNSENDHEKPKLKKKKTMTYKKWNDENMHYIHCMCTMCILNPL